MPRHPSPYISALPPLACDHQGDGTTIIFDLSSSHTGCAKMLRDLDLADDDDDNGGGGGGSCGGGKGADPRGAGGDGGGVAARGGAKGEADENDLDDLLDLMDSAAEAK